MGILSHTWPGRKYLFLIAVIPTMAACAAPTPQVVTTEVTRIVLQMQAAEVTREVVITARPVEVTRVVEVTRIVEQTVAPVIVTATADPTAAPTVAPTPRPQPAAPKTVNAESVIAAFKAAGLEAEAVRPLTKDDYGLAPFVGSGLHFTIPSLCPDCGGRVFLLEDAVDRERLKSYYVAMGKASALVFSWVFERAPIIVQINGDLPESQARAYEAALQALP